MVSAAVQRNGNATETLNLAKTTTLEKAYTSVGNSWNSR